MELVWRGLKVAAALALVGAAIAVLPDAFIDWEAQPAVLPDELRGPIVAVLNLDRYFPIHEMIAVAIGGLTIRLAFIVFGLTTWAWNKIFG